jgi:hypothetical protein
MMMACGHVIAKDSLTKLSKTSGWVSGLLLVVLADGFLVLEDVSSVHTVQRSRRLRQL